MRVRGLMLCLLLSGCEDPGRAPEAEPAKAAVAKAAVAESAPSSAAPEAMAVQPASPSPAAQYRDAAMQAAQTRYEQDMAGCATAPDPGGCETSAAAVLEAAERAIRLEYEARLQDETVSPDGG